MKLNIKNLISIQVVLLLLVLNVGCGLDQAFPKNNMLGEMYVQYAMGEDDEELSQYSEDQIEYFLNKRPTYNDILTVFGEPYNVWTHDTGEERHSFKLVPLQILHKGVYLYIVGVDVLYKDSTFYKWSFSYSENEPLDSSELGIRETNWSINFPSVEVIDSATAIKLFEGINVIVTDDKLTAYDLSCLLSYVIHFDKVYGVDCAGLKFAVDSNFLVFLSKCFKKTREQISGSGVSYITFDQLKASLNQYHTR